MANRKNNKSSGIPTQKMKSRVEVMYQNLQGCWYAFADLDGEIYFAKVPMKYALEKDDSKALEVIKKSKSKAA